MPMSVGGVLRFHTPCPRVELLTSNCDIGKVMVFMPLTVLEPLMSPSVSMVPSIYCFTMYSGAGSVAP